VTRQFLSEMGAESLRHHALRRFVELFGRHPDSVIIVPGRVNLIGEHVDYNEGWVLPAAIDRKMLLVVRKRPDRKIVIVDLGRDEKLEREIGARP
jgi:galactokinase